MSKHFILMVEDHYELASTLCEFLEEHGFVVDHARNLNAARQLLKQQRYHILLLDINLPDGSGYELCEWLRNKEAMDLPVLMLTARDGVEDRVLGLDGGADDYLVKPFAFPELLARIRALLRRGRPDQALRLQVGALEMDLVTRRVARADRELHLTTREYELLQYLMRHHGHLVSREMLAQDVWKETSRATPLDNVIDVHIARLRKKVDTGPHAPLIHTVRGVGFVLQEKVP